MPLTPNLSFTGLDEFVNEPVVENIKAMSSEEEPKVVRKNNDALIIEEWVSDSEEENVSQTKTEKKTVKPSIAKIEFVKPKQQEKTNKKTVKQRVLVGIIEVTAQAKEIQALKAQVKKLKKERLGMFKMRGGIRYRQGNEVPQEDRRHYHNLWDVIVNGDLEKEPALTGETSAPPAPKTAKQLDAKRNQERVKRI
ncbi:hypothetical protein Tco_0945765 [Tanacetum coccineum]